MVPIEDYIIVDEYAVSLTMNVACPPTKHIANTNPVANQENEIGLSIEFQEESGLFYVNIKYHGEINLGEELLFSIDLLYRGEVVINFSLKQEVIRGLLNVEIPQELYSSVQDIVKSTTTFSGYPAIELDYYSFKEKRLK